MKSNFPLNIQQQVEQRPDVSHGDSSPKQVWVTPELVRLAVESTHGKEQFDNVERVGTLNETYFRS